MYPGPIQYLSMSDQVVTGDVRGEFDRVNEAANKAVHEELSVLREAGPGELLEGSARDSYEEKVEASTHLLQQRETLRRALELDKAQRKQEAEFADTPRGETGAPDAVSLGDLMKSFGRHDKGYIDLGTPGVRKEKVGSTIVNRGVVGGDLDLSAETLAKDGIDLADVKTREGRGGTRVLLHQLPYGSGKTGIRTEEFNLDTSTANVNGSFPVGVAPLMTQMFEQTALGRLATVVPTDDLNDLTFSVRKKLAALTGNDVSEFDGVGGTDAANTNANATVEAMLAGNGVTAVGEGKAIPTAEETFTKVTLKTAKWGYITPVTWELMNRVSGWSVESLVVDDMRELMGLTVGFLTMRGAGGGTTHTQPQGLHTEIVKSANDTRSVTSGNAAAGLKWDEMVDAQHKPVSTYSLSPSSAWIAAWATCGAIRKIKADGYPLFDPDPTGEFPGYALGRPIVPDDSMPAIADGAKGVILYGDASKYVLRTAGGVRLDYSFEDGFRTDTSTWRVLFSFDGRLAIPEAFSRIDIGS